MPDEARFCSNCRAELSHDADACPECGVYAGDVFDGKLPRKPSRLGVFLPLLILALIAAGAAIWINKARPDAPPPKPVVKKIAPKIVNGRVNEAEAIRVLRRHLAATYGIPSNCVATISHGQQRGAFVIAAVNSCEHVRLGTWRVDAKNGAVAK